MARGNAVVGVLVVLVCMGLSDASPAEAATTVTLTSDRVAPQPPGTVIRWSAAAGGGTAPYSFKWWLFDGTSWILLRDWSSSSTFDWTPSTANSSYRIGLWVRSAGVTADKDESNASAYFAITAGTATTVSSRVTAVTLNADQTAPQPVGTVVTWTAQSSGGKTPHSYKWWLFDGTGWTLLRDWSTSASLAWTPAIANPSYRIGVWVRSAGNSADADENNQAAYFAISSSSAKVTAVTLQADRTAPQPAGTTVRWTAAATGGTGPVSYKWWVDDGLQWTLLSDWSSNPEIRWTPATPNEAFRIGVWARSATSTADKDEANISETFPVRGGVVDCLDALDPAVLAFGSHGGTGAFRVIPADASCQWTATSQASWVTVTAPGPGSGEGHVTIAVAANADRVSRTGFIMVGGRALSITQGGGSSEAGCTYAVFPTTLDVGFGNESARVAVTAPDGCTWGASGAGFVHLTPGSGTGSDTLTISIENNTAVEPRAAVVTIAGRAVTVTQAGRSANTQGCTYAVSPHVADFGSDAAAASVVISASSDCHWTAATGSEFVHLTGATSGSGDGTVTFAIDTNLSGGTRSALMMVAGEAVTLTQRPSVLIPSCDFTLSRSSATVPYAGGSGAVSVSTASDCEWNVVSHTDWIHIIESSGPFGSGSVWFSVDANTGAARAGSLVIGGQAFTISQGEPPSSVSGDDITWVTPPDPERVGQCEGNCGAGCGTFFNPCGGPHYWERTVISPPHYVGDDWEPVCSGSSSWYVVRPRFTAVVRWTYHGLKSSKCEEHDATCRNLNFIPFLPVDKALCLATAGLVGLNGLNYCDDAQPFDWSYEFVDIGHGSPVAFIDGAPSCE